MDKLSLIPNKIEKKLYYIYDYGYDFTYEVSYNQHTWYWFMIVDEDMFGVEHPLNMTGKNLCDGIGRKQNTKIDELIQIAEQHGINYYYEKV